MQKRIGIMGVLAALIISGGVGCGNVGNVGNVEAPKVVEASVVEPVVTEPIVAPTEQTDFNGDSYPIPDDGKYHSSVHNAPGIVVQEIIFHEGFRAKGLKALDVHVIARSANGENALAGGRDEIVSATGSSGKVYNMEGSKGTGVTSNYRYKTYTEERIIQYIDVDESEKTIVSVVLRRDGKLITIKPDENTKYDTTYAVMPSKATAKATTQATTTIAVTTPAPTPAAPVKTIGKLTLEHHSWGTGEYSGEIVNGKANGQGEAHWRNIPSGNVVEYTWKGNFENNSPMYKGTKTWTDKDGVTKSIYTEVEGIN